MSAHDEGNRLSAPQRAMVEQNRGLVWAHLRRHVGRWWQLRREREADDLFQEGCLGLIDAARTYRAASGISFSNWARPRIHTAVRRALTRSFSTLTTPIPKKRGNRPARRRALEPPQLVALTFDPLTPAPVESPPPGDTADAPTIGQRIREKYRAAVQRAVQKLPRQGQCRADRYALVERLVEQHLSIPEEAERTSLRDLARQTGSSYGRVRQASQRLTILIRQILAADPEFAALREESRRHPHGGAACLDDEVARRLAHTEARRFAALVTRLTPARRDGVMLRLLETGGRGQLAALASELLLRLSPAQRESLYGDLHERRRRGRSVRRLRKRRTSMRTRRMSIRTRRTDIRVAPSSSLSA